MDLSSKKIGTPINQRNTTNQGSRTVGKMQHFGDQVATKHLIEGQIVKGEVTDLRNNQVSILLDDNTSVIGRLDQVNWLSIGDIGSFKVESIEGGTIRLQAIPLSDSEIENNTMFKALEEAGLPHNSRNQSIVLSLIRNQLPITKPSIQNILRQSYELKEARISTIVLMNKYNIPATHENATQFEHYLCGDNVFASQLSSCLEQIPSMLREMVLFADEQMNDVAKQFLDLVNKTNSETILPDQNPTYTFSSNKLKNEVFSILSDFDLPDEAIQALKENPVSLPDLVQLLKSAYEQASMIDSRNQEEVLSNLSPDELADSILVETALAEIPRTIEVFEHPEFTRIQDAYQDFLKSCQLTGGYFNEFVREKLVDFLNQNPTSSSLCQQVKSGEATLNELLDGIQNTISFATPDSIQELFVSKEFAFLISNELKKKWALTPDEVRKKNLIGTFYQKVSNQVKGIEKLIQNLSPEFSENHIGENLASVKNNINFMQLLNEIFPYIQIPFHMNGQNGNGELYVYTKKEELKRNPHQIRVLLHLSLEQLGNIDIHITKNGLILDNKFYIEDEQSRRLLKKNIHLLRDKLQELGYSVTNDFSTKESKVDLVKDFIGQKEPATAIKRYTFDIRA